MTDNSDFHESKHIEWSINNFFDEPNVVDYKLESSCVSLSDAKWFLRIFTNGEVRNNTYGYISLYLRRDESSLEHDVFCRLGMKREDGTEFKAYEYKHTFLKGDACGWGFPTFIERPHLLKFKEVVAPNGTLTVFCTFRVMNKPVLLPDNIESASQTRYDGTSTVIKDLQDMYFSGLQSDLRITVKNKEFRAHRNILSSRSSVFKSMLLHDMMEKSSGCVRITDGDPDTFEDFLLFLYTGKCDYVSSRNAVSLYSAADKYDVKELKDECVRCMVDELSNDVFCDVLLLAAMQNEKDLLKAVTEYFINNAKTIVKTTTWHTVLEEHPIVANELFFQYIISKDNVEK